MKVRTIKELIIDSTGLLLNKGCRLRRFTRKRMTEGGFTLLEIIMSIVIMSIAVTGLYAIVTTSIASRNAPQPFEITIGTQYVQDKLEKIYADKRNPSSSRGFANIDTAHYPGETLGNGYTRTTTVGAWSVNPDTNAYKQITVQVLHNGVTVASATTLVTKY